MNHGQWMLVYLRRGIKSKKGITESLNFTDTVTELIAAPPYLSQNPQGPSFSLLKHYNSKLNHTNPACKLDHQIPQK